MTCTLLVISPPSVQADVRIVVDASNSMDSQDPQNLRGAAIEQLVRTLPEDSYAGVWGYAKIVTQAVKYAPADRLWQQIAVIQGQHMVEQPLFDSDQADLINALEAATWDLAERSKRPALGGLTPPANARPIQSNTSNNGASHIVLISNGLLNTGKTKREHDNDRQLLLNAWASRLASAGIFVHTIAITAASKSKSENAGQVGKSRVAGQDSGALENPYLDFNLLRQISQLSGGLHKLVRNKAELQEFLLDLQALINRVPQAEIDNNGRFEIAPGAQRLTALWFLDEKKAQSAYLLQPDGTVINRLTPLTSGQWVRAQNFELVSLQQPQSGWWRVVGIDPAQLQVIGEIDIRVDGLNLPVIPSEESHALVRLYSQGKLVNNDDFLDLLDVQVWLNTQQHGVKSASRGLLPIERTEDGFKAYFVSLGDGAHELEVVVNAPTFKRKLVLPFVAVNPLKVEVEQKPGENAFAWLTFSHAEVDYASVKAALQVRKPPQVGQIIPATQMPGGLFHVPIPYNSGSLESSFSITGNYLNGKGFHLKTKRQTISLPVTETMRLRFGADGKLLTEGAAKRLFDSSPGVTDGASMPDMAADNVHLALNTQQQNAAAEDSSSMADLVKASSAQQNNEPIATIPWWMIGAITGVNLLLGLLLWWWQKPAPLDLDEVAEQATSAEEDAKEAQKPPAKDSASKNSGKPAEREEPVLA